MIQVQSTPNEAGVFVLGDRLDFESLYHSLHDVVGDEGEWELYDGARIRVLGVCYDLRHALMADRGIEFVENGLDKDAIKRVSIIAPETNVYYKFEVLWPEILFVTMALNDFIWLYAKKQSKNSYSALTEWRNLWDPVVSHVRRFQSAVTMCLKDTISEASFSRVLKQMNRSHPWMDRYLTQYIDVINIRFLEMDPDTRKKNISVMAKRIAEKSKEYMALEQDVRVAARAHHCRVADIKIPNDYPEEIDW